LICVAAAGGQFSDGYVLGTIGIALGLAQGALHLNAVWLGMLGAASLAGLFLGSLVLAPLADRVGRRPLFLPTMAIFAAASVLQFFIHAPWQLLALRVLLGLALGVDYVVCSAIVAEFSPRRSRGRLLSSLAFAWSAGYSTAYIVGASIALHAQDGWRWILLSSAVPASIVFFIRLLVPESPPWLVQRGRTTEAAAIVARHFGPNIRLPNLLQCSKTEPAAKWSELWSAKYRRRTLVGATFYTAQVIPYFAMGTFIPTVFTALGVRDVYAGGVVFNTFLLLGSACGLWVVDKLTRRQFLIGGFYIPAATLLVLVTASTAPPVVIVALFALFAFVLAAATNLEFGYLPELFPTRLRATGVGIGTAASRIGSACSTFLLPLSVQSLGIRSTLGLCVIVLVLGGIVCQLFAPETQGQSLEDSGA
jgi:putative MFS transporter